jgi:hypothetical protein
MAENGSAAPSVFKKGIYRLLKHPFFVSNNNVRRSKLQEFFKSVVSIYNTPIEIV